MGGNAHVIEVTMLKGGVHKTTLSSNVSHGLAKLNHRTLLVDCDTQNQCGLFLGLETGKGLGELLMEGEQANFRDFIYPARKNLDLLPAGENLALANRTISLREVAPEQALSEVLGPALEHYDYIILDSAPGWDSLAVNCLVFADELICPVIMEVPAISSLGRLQKRIKPVQKYRQQLRISIIVPSGYVGRVPEQRRNLKDLREHFGDLVAAPIRRRDKFAEAPAYGQTIFEYDTRNPQSRAARRDYWALIRRITGARS